MRRDTECFSMYSDMSMRSRARSSSKRNSARARASSVLPTPVGPRKMNEPMGRLGSLSPARERGGEVVDSALHPLLRADDTLTQALFHGDQFLHFAFEHLGHWNAGPFG